MIDDAELWERKRHKFSRLVRQYQSMLRFDETRVYLTGFSFAGSYAWMLAYDQPDRYAGVVAMSAVSYPRQIQERLKSGAAVVTVVVRGEQDRTLPEGLSPEKETGRIIESQNPHSRFILKQGEDHREVAKHWAENLRYILRFRSERLESHDSPAETVR
jgi:predicted peptidase